MIEDPHRLTDLTLVGQGPIGPSEATCTDVDHSWDGVRSLLSAFYTAAGFTPDPGNITDCQSGTRAANTWFVLREPPGYPSVRIHDGSWSEYGTDPAGPIER